jgi:hypothetical protein
MALMRKYFGLPVATLQTMQTETLAAISAVKVRGQSTSTPDLGMTFASLKDLGDDLAEINAALAAKQGTAPPFTIARMN